MTKKYKDKPVLAYENKLGHVYHVCCWNECSKRIDDRELLMLYLERIHCSKKTLKNKVCRHCEKKFY